MVEDIHPTVRRAILERLEAISRRDEVCIVHAVEAGSRAWGFPSPDSDYDVRFIYVHRPDWYLRLEPRPSATTEPIAADLDVSGWDLGKALILLRRSNPSLLEHLRSPITYVETALSRRLAALALAHPSLPACRHHYLNMARRNVRDHLLGETASIKRYLYILRPLLAVAWLDGEGGLPPLRFRRLLETRVADGPLRRGIDELLELKQVSRECVRIPRRPCLDEFIAAELDRHARTAPADAAPPLPWPELDAFFLDALRATWPSGKEESGGAWRASSPPRR